MNATTLKTTRNNIISSRIRNISITPDVIKVKNKLLDGSTHTQTLGKPSFEVYVEFDLDQVGKKILDEAYITDEPLRLELKSEGKYYEGLLQAKPVVDNYIVNRKTKKYVARLTIDSLGEMTL